MGPFGILYDVNRWAGKDLAHHHPAAMKAYAALEQKLDGAGIHRMFDAMEASQEACLAVSYDEERLLMNVRPCSFAMSL